MIPKVGSWWRTKSALWPSTAFLLPGFGDVFHEVKALTEEDVCLIQNGSDWPYFLPKDEFERKGFKPFRPRGSLPSWVRPGVIFHRLRGRSWMVATVRGRFFTAEIRYGTFRFFGPSDIPNLRPYLTWHERIMATD
jgi:hypothetical protein